MTTHPMTTERIGPPATSRTHLHGPGALRRAQESRRHLGARCRGEALDRAAICLVQVGPLRRHRKDADTARTRTPTPAGVGAGTRRLRARKEVEMLTKVQIRKRLIRLLDQRQMLAGLGEDLKEEYDDLQAKLDRR